MCKVCNDKRLRSLRRARFLLAIDTCTNINTTTENRDALGDNAYVVVTTTTWLGIDLDSTSNLFRFDSHSTPHQISQRSQWRDTGNVGSRIEYSSVKLQSNRKVETKTNRSSNNRLSVYVCFSTQDCTLAQLYRPRKQDKKNKSNLKMLTNDNTYAIMQIQIHVRDIQCTIRDIAGCALQR